MPRPTTKNDLLIAAADNYKKLNELISNLTKKELDTPFDFYTQIKMEKKNHFCLNLIIGKLMEI